MTVKIWENNKKSYCFLNHSNIALSFYIALSGHFTENLKT